MSVVLNDTMSGAAGQQWASKNADTGQSWAGPSVGNLNAQTNGAGKMVPLGAATTGHYGLKIPIGRNHRVTARLNYKVLATSPGTDRILLMVRANANIYTGTYQRQGHGLGLEWRRTGSGATGFFTPVRWEDAAPSDSNPTVINGINGIQKTWNAGTEKRLIVRADGNNLKCWWADPDGSNAELLFDADISSLAYNDTSHQYLLVLVSNQQSIVEIDDVAVEVPALTAAGTITASYTTRAPAGGLTALTALTDDEGASLPIDSLAIVNADPELAGLATTPATPFNEPANVGVTGAQGAWPTYSPSSPFDATLRIAAAQAAVTPVDVAIQVTVLPPWAAGAPAPAGTWVAGV